MFCWEQRLATEEMLSSGGCICLARSNVAFSLQFQYYSRVSSQTSEINRLQIKINRNTAPKLAWMILCCHLICQETSRTDPCLKTYCCSPVLSLGLFLSFFFSSLFLIILFQLRQVNFLQSWKTEWFGTCFKCEDWVEFIVDGWVWPVLQIIGWITVCLQNHYFTVALLDVTLDMI